MRLREIVLDRPQSIEAAANAQDALDRMKTAGTSSIVVLRGKDVAGVLSAATLSALTATERSQQHAADVATEVVPLHGDDTIKEAANLMRSKGIECVPVADDGKLIGVVTVDRLLELIGRGAVHEAPPRERRVLRDRGDHGVKPAIPRSSSTYSQQTTENTPPRRKPR